jgi:hypothetical protein
MRRLISAAAVVAVAAIVPATGVAKKDDNKNKTKTFTTTLRGSSEVPGPGDPNGKGSAVIKIRGAKLCYDIKMQNIAGSSAAHIHAAKKGVAGDVAVALFGSQSDAKRRKGCVEPGSDKLAAIRKAPKNFYVNVHNADFPAGAIRGQLKKR